MTIGTYDTHTLLGVVRTLRDPMTYWLDLCFPSQQNFTDEWIDFDIVDSGRRLAPFVAPTAQGKPMLQDGYSTRRFKPAYVKPKDPVSPNRVIKRLAGESFTGGLSPEQRHQAIIADILQQHRNMHVRRREWMAAEAIIKGQVTVTGDDYPSVTIAFGRAAGQTVVLTTTDRWSDYTNSDPIDDLETWVNQTQEASGGFAPTRVTMGTNAWAYFKNHPKVKDQLDTTIRGNMDTINRSIGDGSPAQYKGTVGVLQVWVYSDVYEDNSRTLVKFLDPNDVVLTSSGVEGVRCFGAILDPRAGYQALDLYPSNWIENDPPVELLMTQSAPLMVPTRPNATLRATVL